jgi:hypothetical protein
VIYTPHGTVLEGYFGPCLTWIYARLEGMADYLGTRLSFPARLGMPRVPEGGLQNSNDPSFIAPMGLLTWLTERSREDSENPEKENVIEKAFDTAKEWLAAYF